MVTQKKYGNGRQSGEKIQQMLPGKALCTRKLWIRSVKDSLASGVFLMMHQTDQRKLFSGNEFFSLWWLVPWMEQRASYKAHCSYQRSANFLELMFPWISAYVWLISEVLEKFVWEIFDSLLLDFVKERISRGPYPTIFTSIPQAVTFDKAFHGVLVQSPG